ncbi:MAG: hypothetical protein IH623_30825 [Verrucomicrobia bacterium]|nr:hypothetical protein [Verrucomicrobiota bacterium]
MRTLLAFLVMTLLAGCQYNPYAHLFTTTEPKQEDIAGLYVLDNQTITTGGLSVLKGRQCQLDLRLDGSCRVTNYPTWTDAFSVTNGQFVAFVSTTGRWQSDMVGTVSDGRNSQSYWGIRFSNTDSNIASPALTGKTAPYGLIMTYGDPDSGSVMIFKKQK